MTIELRERGRRQTELDAKMIFSVAEWSPYTAACDPERGDVIDTGTRRRRRGCPNPGSSSSPAT